MKKTKFFTCIAMLGLVLSLGACTTNDDTGSSNPSSSDTGTSSDTGGSTDTSGTEEHTHSYEVTEHKDATCTEAGYDVYTCSCGDTYTDPIDALGHDYQPTVTNPTCGEKGYTTYTCSRCGDSYTADETDPTGEHTPAGQYLSDETGHWQLCSVCNQVVGFEAHTAAEGYQSDETSHWQVCSVCGYKMNEVAHTAGSVGVIDQLTHGTKCTVCQKVLTQENHTYQAVYDDYFEEWDEVCTVCGYEGGEVDLEDKYVLYGDFADSSWNESPTDSTYTLEYNSEYPVTKVWTRTVKMTAYSGQDYRASFRIIEYGNYDADVVTASHLDASSTGVYESSWNIAVHWGGTYDITIDCSGTTPTIHLDYYNDGYEEPAYTAYALTGDFADSAWSVEPAENSTYYISLDETTAERTVTLATDLGYDPSFYVVGWGTWNHVLDYSNLTADSDSNLKASNDNGIAGEDGQTYDLVLDFVNNTIKVTIHEEEVDTSITNETNLQAALNEGGDITLESDIVVTGQLVASKDATLNMNGYTIYNETEIWDTDANIWSLLSIQNGAKVTITGNGTFAGLENDPYAVDVRDGSTLTIENGTFVGNVTCIYAYDGFVYIYGGHFSILQTSSINGPYKYVLNCLDANNKAGTACFYLYGGEYENFDPSVATGTTGEDGNTLYEAVVMDGYTVVSSDLDDGGTLYSVVEAVEEEHTFVADLSSLPAAGFGEENTSGTNNPKSGVWTRGIFYYWNDQWWVSNNVTVKTAAYDSETEAYVFSWTGDNTSNPFAFQIFYTLPEEAGLEVGATYSLKISFTADFTGYIEINGTAVYANIGENTVTIDGLTATELSDLSIQLGDNLYVAGGAFIQNGTFSITYLAFDF